MLSTLTRLLMHRQLIFGDGEIKLMNQPVVFNALITELELLKELEKRGEEKLIYLAAKKAGTAWFAGMSEAYKELKPKDVMQWGPELINLAGWGTVKPLKANIETGELEFNLINSSLANAYGHSTKPVDHYFRGLVTGAWSFACQQDLEGIEIACKSVDKNECTFVIKPRNKFDLNDKQVNQQI